jgi:3-oxosteroid 1-dehydrogenase
VKRSNPSSTSDRVRMPSRRDVLKGLAAGSAASLIPLAASAAKPAKPAKTNWAGEADVLIVGSGAAGLSAAVAAVSQGSSVIIFEKMPFQGGTTAKSGGVFWIPNNGYLKSQKVPDERLDALQYMVRLSHPTRYVPSDPLLGITQAEFDLIAAFYDNAPEVVEALGKNAGLKYMPWLTWEDKAYPDYYSDLPENKVRRGRSLVPDSSADPKLVVWPKNGGAGPALIHQLMQGLDKKPAQMLLDHKVLDVIRNADGAVVGLSIDRGDDAPVSFRARKGVVFCTGGFTHNPELAREYLKGQIWGGCAAPGSTGDFVNIATRAGAVLGNMNNAWWGQVQVEAALKTRSVAVDVWSTPGDSMIQVNRYGRRFVNEKIQYNERAQAHFTWDPVRAEYPNLLGFMIWDARTAQHYAGYDPIPAANAKLPQVIEGATLDELAANIELRLASLAKHTGGFTLDKNFRKNLSQTIERFNGFATAGKDEDFSRGEATIEIAFQFMNAAKAPNPNPSITMHPIDVAKGPFYAVILGAGTLDTKGGPVVNVKGQVLDADAKPIPGLYAAGNCVAHPAAQAYWAGGGTIGPALTFGWLAGTSASGEAVRAA